MSDNALGLDVSLWQDNNSTPQQVDFAQARAAGAHFVFIKASQACWLDQDFLFNWQHARAAGLLRGAYHFFTWDATPLDQARYFASLLRADPGEIEPVADFECRLDAPGAAVATNALYAFASEVEQQTGRRVMIYTSPGYWREFWSGKYVRFFASRPLWLAHYYVPQPSIPLPWTEWTFWQFGLGKGQGPQYGAESLDIDQDWFAGTAEALAARYGQPTQPLPAEPSPALPTHGTVRVDGLRLRAAPGLEGKILGSLYSGQPVEILERQADPAGRGVWYRVRSEGWTAGTWQGQEYIA